MNVMILTWIVLAKLAKICLVTELRLWVGTKHIDAK